MTGEIEQRRGYPARAGIAALNLIVPGLGLLRLGRWRSGAAFLLAPFALVGVTTLGVGHLPISSHRHATLALAALLAASAAMFLLPVMLTWRAGRVRRRPAPGSRWYMLATTALVVLALLQAAQMLAGRLYRPFDVPSESMMPTLRIGDRFTADMRWRGPFCRGDVVLLDRAGGVRIGRIVGLPGDRVAMRGGVPIVNRIAAIRRPHGDRSRTLVERLPSEPSPHRVLDSGRGPLGEMPEVLVPPNHIFLLGDHRDRSADSRMSVDQGGIGMVPADAILGRPLYVHWSSDRPRTGIRLHRAPCSR